MPAVPPAASLLQLPDSCRVEVLRCCADDPRSLCSAARANSRLHQAAVHALSSINVETITRQGLDSLVQVYLASQGQHVDSISLGGYAAVIDQLPPVLTKLSSLELKRFQLQLQPGGGCQGVLGAAVAPPLKQLRLNDCKLLDGEEGLVAALLRLPGLEHLSIIQSSDSHRGTVKISGDMLLKLQQLTNLQLEQLWLGDTDGGTADLKHLSALTRLVELRLALSGKCSVTASMLSGAHSLTCLQLTGPWEGDGLCFEPDTLAGMTRLQNLELHGCDLTPVSGTLSQLQALQQLTRLVLHDSLRGSQAFPPAAAYSALTASSKLQHLDISNCSLPAGVWQHVFAAGRQLPHLHLLNISYVPLAWRLDGVPAAAAPEGSRLASCCPGLQSLDMRGWQYSAEGLGALTGLSNLHTLRLRATAGPSEWSEAAWQLPTVLRQLDLSITY